MPLISNEDLARYYAHIGYETSVVGGEIDTADLLFVTTAAGSEPAKYGRFRGDGIFQRGAVELTWPSSSGTIALTSDIGAGFTTSAELAALLSDETGYSSGAFAVFSKNPTLVNATFTGTGTGTALLAPWASNDAWYALGMAGSVAAGAYNLRSGPADTHLYINAPSSREIRFRINDVSQAVLEASGLVPASAGSTSLGRAGLGWNGLYLDSSSSSNSIAIVGGAVSPSNITLTTPTSTGTLALTSDIAATVDKAFVDALGVDADTLDGLDSTDFSLAGHDHDADYSPIFTDSAGLAALLSDEQGSGGGFVRATSPTLVTPNIGAATGTSLDLNGGGLGLDQAQSIWFNGLSSGSRIRQDISANMQFSVSATDVWRILADGNWVPNAATWGVGSASVGVSGVYFDDGGGDTARVVAPSLSGDITVTLPAAAGTLTRTDGDAIGQTTAAAGKFTTLQRRAGTSTGYGGAVVTLDSQFTAVGNVGGGTDDLMTYTLPANALATNGDWVRITASFSTASNANNKLIALSFGGSLPWTSGSEAYNGADIVVVTTIMRTGSNTQTATTHAGSTSSLFTLASAAAVDITLAATDTSTIVIKFTGTATSTNDIQQHSMLIEYGSLS